jgi:uncharacterized membrane protein
MRDAAADSIAKCRLARALALLALCLTAAISLLWSHAKLLSQDEMYEYQTDSVRSMAQLVHVQRTSPISLDPLLYHLLSHGAMQLFGAGAFAQRLPALLGFLLMQNCLFFFVRRLAGERAAALAAAFPALTATLLYSAEGRPYGLMLGLYALALCCWQDAARRSSQRIWPLVGLGLALAATINAHYFGILLLVPVCAAEVWRTLGRRRIDWPMTAAIVLGTSGFLATRPFLRAAGEFRKNYYNGGGLSLHDITRAYRSIFVDYTRMSLPVQHTAAVLLIVLAATLLWGWTRAISSGTADHGSLRISATERVLVLTLAALPFFGYLLARFVTHSIEVRYVLGAVVAISAMAAVAVSPLLRRDATFTTIAAALLVSILGAGALRIHAEQRRTSDRLASLLLPAQVSSALAQSVDGRLYIQDMGAFEEDRYYEPDPDLRARMTLVYSPAEELRWNRHDTMALTALHLQQFTTLPVISYETLKAQPGEHIFVLFHTGWDWTDEAFAEDGAKLRPLGHAMGGDVVAVRFQ